MDIQLATAFFMWCSIINIGILLIWAGFYMFAPDLMYKTQSLFFKGSRESFDTMIYVFLGVFKLFVLLFNITPYLALLIIA